MPDRNASAYVGRFAPSPTGPLHAGSLVAALASWLDAKAHGGKWLVRIEDVDTPRCVPGADQIIIGQLADCGLHPDEPPLYQSQRGARYQAALDQLVAQRQAYPCGCSRQDIEEAQRAAGYLRPRGADLIYPGTCRHGLAGKAARSWRFAVEATYTNQAADHIKQALAAPDSIATEALKWTDRWCGDQSQDVSAAVGDFVLKRADGLWAYQLAVVVDDAAQGVTHVVRGSDLVDNTARQILLQRALGLAQLEYLHVPVVNAPDGHKLSKQNNAAALQTSAPQGALHALQNAGAVLGIKSHENTAEEWLVAATDLWAQKYSS
jgi:glutamyl-Q tRNA(Asp) synthetase